MPNDKTQAIHSGTYQDQQFNSVATPIYLSSLFAHDPLSGNPYNYSRFGNPTRTALEEKLTSLEKGASGATATSSGMAAIHLALLLLSPGDHILIHNDVFGGTLHLLKTLLRRQGYGFSQVDMTQPELVKAAIRPETRMFWIETPSNPLLAVLDIAELSKIAKAQGALTVVDNTFMSPIGQSPLELGADLVVHSTSKFINGHSDVISGAVISKSPETAAEIRSLATTTGVTASPFDCWMVLRGIKTLPHRMSAHQSNTLKLIEFLQKHPAIQKIYYPGLPTHPGHEVAKKQQKHFGSVLSILLDDAVPFDAFIKELQLFQPGFSLGGVESIISHPWSMSHASMPEGERLKVGIMPNLFRLSVGLECPEDLIKDLQTALEVAAMATA